MSDFRKDCLMRHENGNCNVIGGFCTAVNDPICEGLHNAYDCGYCDGETRAKRQQEHPQWISVKDRLPEHGTRVLVCDIYAHNRYIGVWFFEKDPDDGSDCWEECGGGWQPLDAVTHWMPLPELPEDGEK